MIFYIAFGTDAAGAAYADERVMAELHAAANAPVFAPHSVYLGAGIVGGRLLSIDDIGRRTADAALGILNGAWPRRVEVMRRSPSQAIFDWRELQRWGIPESRLPAGSVVRYRSPNLWTRIQGHGSVRRRRTWSMQALLIFGLLVERRARQQAESDSRRNLTLAADANRRETMSALTTSIAHELAQPHQFDDSQRPSAANDGQRR